MQETLSIVARILCTTFVAVVGFVAAVGIGVVVVVVVTV